MFEYYIKHLKWRNVLTKMLSGSFAYSHYKASMHTVDKAKQRLCSMVWFRLESLPIPSNLLLYETDPFRLLVPNPVVFGLPARNHLNGSQTRTNTTREGVLRVNTNSKYYEFKTKTFIERNGVSLVETYNQEDLEVYDFAQRLFCARLRRASGLIEAALAQGLPASQFQACDDFPGQVEDYCNDSISW
jgi:hypothetical protein